MEEKLCRDGSGQRGHIPFPSRVVPVRNVSFQTGSGNALDRIRMTAVIPGL